MANDSIGIVDKVREFLPRGSLPAVFARGSNAALAFLSTLVIARVLGAESYGSYALAVTTIGLLAFAGQLGFDALTPRTLAVYVQNKDWGHAFSFLRWTTRVVVIASILAYLLATLVLTWNPMGWSPAEVLASRLILLGLPFAALLRVERSRLQAFDKTAVGLFFELPFWNTLLLLSGILLFLVPGLRTSAWMAALHALTFAVAFAGAHLSLRRLLPPRPAQLEPIRRDWMKHGASFTAIAGLSFLLNQGDVLLIGTFLSEVSTAHFSVAVRIAGLTLIVLQPLQQIVAPRIARAWAKGDKVEASRIAKRCAQFSLLAGVPMAIAFWAGGPLLHRLFGSGFEDALWALRWLSLAQVLWVSVGPAGLVLQMTHQETASIWILVGSLVIGIPLTIYLMANYGIEGAAFAKVITLSGSSLAAYIVVHRKLGIDISPLGRSPKAP